MKLSTKVRYGSRALAEMAQVWPDGTMSVKDIAEKQSVSPKYLENILAGLKAAGIVQSVRGMYGGYALSRSPRDITLKHVFQALEGSIAPVDCVDHPESCPIENTCPTRQTWAEMKAAMEKVLRRTTLQNLLDRKKRKTASVQASYQI